MIGVAVLGSTGSVGESTLDVLARHRERFRLVALAAHHNVTKLAEQIRTWQPPYAALADESAARELATLLGTTAPHTRVLAGAGALEEIATLREADCVMAAIVGAAGLRSTLAAARAGKRLLLANKESLVMGGALLMAAVRESGATLLPIDSEHNAIFQCLPAGTRTGIAPPGLTRVLLTASGGPFRNTPREQLADATPEKACAHPTWVMGRKISVDSATLMNKGLELIEACAAVRSDAVAGRDRGASAEHRALAGRVCRRLGARAAGLARHAHADRARARLARTHPGRCRISRLAEGGPPRLPAARLRQASVASRSPGRRPSPEGCIR